jgi:hypothetical protein
LREEEAHSGKRAVPNWFERLSKTTNGTGQADRTRRGFELDPTRIEINVVCGKRMTIPNSKKALV